MTIAARRACGSLAVVLMTVLPLCAQDAEDFVGSWTGTGDAGQLVLHIEHAADGELTGSVDSPHQGIFGIPAFPVEVEDGHLTLHLESVEGRITGALTADGSEIVGEMIVGERSFPLALHPLTDAVAATLPQHPAAQRPEAEPDDVRSPDAIVKAAYEVISGPPGEEPDWDRFRSLFLPQARLISTGRGAASIPTHRARTVEEFADRAPREEGFYESEVHEVTERFGDIAHVFSTYESRRSPDVAPFARGINSFQLWYDGDRWWIVNLLWHVEREGAPIPTRYGGSK